MQLPNEDEKNIIQAIPKITQLELTSNVLTMIPLSLDKQIGNENKLKIDESGYIVIGSNINSIKINAKLYIGYNHLTNYQYDIFSAIYKIHENEEEELDWSVATGINSRINQFQGSRQTVNMLVANVNAGDKIKWAIRTNGISDNFINISNTRNKFIVEAI